MTNGQSSPARIVLIVVLAVAAALLAAAGVWYWRGQKIDELSDSIAQLERQQSEESDRLSDQLRQLEDDLAAARRELEARTTATSTTASGEFTSEKGVTILVSTPAENETVSSPLTVTGQVPGNWSFEASFPVQLLDSDGNMIAQEPAQLQGDWMTTELVDFEVTLTFTAPPGGGTGTLVLKKDNPSGMADKDDELRIPIRF
ncbi:MAG: Gmad2 immunoglobulin-like domain-containing protein [Pseudomonadota bacterium]